MSRRTAIIEEFDDDTDLPLPSHPLPNTGTTGPLLEEIDIAYDKFEPSQSHGGDPSASHFRQPDINKPNANNTVTDITPYKSWTCIYPIYIDAKRPYGTGERRIQRQKSVWWPLSKDIADATNRLGLGTLHEVNKAHPRDWENPGRVRVQWKKDGRLMNPAIQTKKQLLEMISFQIQRTKPDNIPKPPYLTAPSKPPMAAPPSKSHSKSAKASTPKPPPPAKASGRRLAVPPSPHPPLTSRVSAYSPALPSGVLIETVKAGMNAQENMPGAGSGGGGGAGAGPGGTQKGKRKVVRVRS